MIVSELMLLSIIQDGYEETKDQMKKVLETGTEELR
jgi:hypothetical protein